MLIPLIGGFNDGKHIEPLRRKFLKMAKPSEYKSSQSHYESNIGFEYEIYNLKEVHVGNKKMQVFVIEGMPIEEAFEKLVNGYKQFNKKKGIDLSK